jgi:hypothetical protein
MNSILVFIDGTICDTRHRHQNGTDSSNFYKRENILKDRPVANSVVALQKLSKRYHIIYIGARPEFTLEYTKEWLEREGFPNGEVYLGETQKERLDIVSEIKNEYDFFAGIGDRWDDNELHLEIGCLSIILKEFEGNWDYIYHYLIECERKLKIRENEIRLRGKIEGLVRVLPKLHAKYGDNMWDIYFNAVIETAERSREIRKKEDLASFDKFNLNPKDLRDVAKWEELMHEEEWENNEAYGLQDMEIVEATKNRFVLKVTRCRYAEIWRELGHQDIGYEIHCHTDYAWWDRPAWNSNVRFNQPKTIMKGDDCCLFIQVLSEDL